MGDHRRLGLLHPGTVIVVEILPVDVCQNCGVDSQEIDPRETAPIGSRFMVSYTKEGLVVIEHGLGKCGPRVKRE